MGIVYLRILSWDVILIVEFLSNTQHYLLVSVNVDSL